MYVCIYNFITGKIDSMGLHSTLMIINVTEYWHRLIMIKVMCNGVKLN